MGPKCCQRNKPKQTLQFTFEDRIFTILRKIDYLVNNGDNFGKYT